ncbi:glycosyl transferase [Cryptosporidium canis]|uniref:GDP-Man:Man(3)GlcNAc(2)-PP-Dol alpha-1,2-mannosyltransferase n=1 Tax=Cryptosporidium canis TaxID=195482 RepID=A0ABQ8P5A3_9CRYT|nr:glycosyl transferase [Cryptosporidium canis]KAJ1613436.1 glycosyl transferase [Cryptosporidium canis]
MIFDSIIAWKHERKSTIAFFHPQCCNFGGGEKVLWNIVYEVLADNIKNKVVIYSNSGAVKTKVVSKVEEVFGIPLNNPAFINRITIVELRLGFLLNIGVLKLWTINLAAIIVSLEGLLFGWPFPEVFVETAGFPFSIISAKILPTTKHISTYIHYPQVRKKNIEEEKRRCFQRYFYLKIFSLIYKFSIGLANKVVANSNWTFDMLNELWGNDRIDMTVCRPPINMDNYSLDLPQNSTLRKDVIISLAQFRVEKNHFAQIQIFSDVLKRLREIKDKARKEEKSTIERIYQGLKFKICGSSQDSNPTYREYICSLRKMVVDYGLEDKIELVIDSSCIELQEIMRTSKFAIHTMEDEHFGICVAEFVCSGLLTFAHKSGGPERDILSDFKGGQVGFLASNTNEFVELLTYAILHYDDHSIQDILKNARRSARARYQDNTSFGRTCWKALNI